MQIVDDHVVRIVFQDHALADAVAPEQDGVCLFLNEPRFRAATRASGNRTLWILGELVARDIDEPWVLDLSTPGDTLGV